MTNREIVDAANRFMDEGRASNVIDALNMVGDIIGVEGRTLYQRIYRARGKSTKRLYLPKTAK